MKLARRIAVAAVLCSGPLAALPIADVTSLPASDRAAVNALEAEFFNVLSSQGTDKGMLQTFANLHAEEKLTPEFREKFQQIDQKCGSASAVERVKTVNFGTRVVHDYFVAMHGSCPIRWDLTYVKRGNTWAFDRFNFLTFDGNEWN